MKLELNLSLMAKPAQWPTPAIPAATSDAAGGAGKARPFLLLTQRATKPVRLAAPALGARPAFRRQKSYLRSWRTAELATRHAELKFPTF